MESVSVIIVAKNSPPHLFETLASVNAFASEIIIGSIDIGKSYISELAKNKKIKIVQLPSDTFFADLVKEDLKKEAKGEYILYLDPDEIFPSTTFRTSPQLTSLLDKYDVFYFPRKNIIFGKWITHSRWWPDYQLRLFKKDSVLWPKALHPTAQGIGREYRFESTQQNAILHYNYDTIDQYLEKAIRYAKSEAKAAVKKNEEYNWSDMIKKAVSEFVSRFFAHQGYKDGLHGFALGILQMFYYFLVYFYYWEEKKYFQLTQKELITIPKKFFAQSLFETNYWLIKQNLISQVEKLKNKLLNFFVKRLS